MKRNEEEDIRKKTEKDLEKENGKLRTRAIKAQYEIETYEDKTKEAETMRYQNIQEMKNKNAEIRQRQNDHMNLVNRKSKVESEFTSHSLILKDREADL